MTAVFCQLHPALVLCTKLTETDCKGSRFNPFVLLIDEDVRKGKNANVKNVQTNQLRNQNVRDHAMVLVPVLIRRRAKIMPRWASAAQKEATSIAIRRNDELIDEWMDFIWISSPSKQFREDTFE
ncbi:hypothetical protein LOAG_01048 [Loa loa]|uniref:Uncharacterized protein n=1 Tax=Loa loa TaxID=7209 RepID=A0A1S0UAA5_LOALO|nr:hypothetical protein LOAG_01048 [Loa loa]EFO27428.2 hypothetical protein LOAG_01048 [Loa loa]